MRVGDDRGRQVRALDRETEHAIKNHLAVIVGLCELLLAQTAPDDPRYADLQEINRATREVIAILRRDPNT
jgi:two-component sensor histidine kinase